ncbi:MAG: hypothetical protein WC087_04010 [Candidatus Paceibacterota bacterium]
MKIIVGLDQLLINFVEKIAHKLQDWTGKNNFWFARAILFVFVGSAIIAHGFMLENKEDKYEPVFPQFILDMVIAIFFLGFTFQLEQAVSRTGKFKNFMAQPWGIMPYFRIFYVLYIVCGQSRLFLRDMIFDVDFYRVLTSLSYITCLYLMCGTPKPPSESKIKKFLKSLFQKRELATVSN